MEEPCFDFLRTKETLGSVLLTQHNTSEPRQATEQVSLPPATRCTPPVGTLLACWDSPSPWKRRPPSSGERRSVEPAASSSFLTRLSRQHGVRGGQDRGLPGGLRRAAVGSEPGGLQDPGDGAHQAEGVRGRPPGGGSGTKLV